MKKKYTYRKYDGDDKYSYAIFFAADVKGKNRVIFYGEAKPIICGMGLNEAKWRVSELNNPKPKEVNSPEKQEFIRACNDFIEGR